MQSNNLQNEYKYRDIPVKKTHNYSVFDVNERADGARLMTAIYIYIYINSFSAIFTMRTECLDIMHNYASVLLLRSY